MSINYYNNLINLDNDSFNILLSLFTNKEILKICFSNKKILKKIRWDYLLKDRKINIPFEISHPIICNFLDNEDQKKCFSKFYHHTKGSSIKSWGNLYFNQIEDSSTKCEYIAICCGLYHSVALKQDGSIKTLGYSLE